MNETFTVAYIKLPTTSVSDSDVSLLPCVSFQMASFHCTDEQVTHHFLCVY